MYLLLFSFLLTYQLQIDVIFHEILKNETFFFNFDLNLRTPIIFLSKTILLFKKIP